MSNLILPAIATEVYPNYQTLKYGYEWYLDAAESKRERYRASRVQLIKDNAPIRRCGTQLMSSGTLGLPKMYLWGPEYLAMVRFYLDFIKTGSCLRKTAVVSIRSASHDPAKENALILVDPPDGLHDAWAHCNLHGLNRIKGLKEALAGHDVIITPSHFRLMQDSANLLDDLDPEALVAFTGEMLHPSDEHQVLASGRRSRDFMRCWDGGATFYTCSQGRRHWLDYLALIWLDGIKLYSSDYYNLAQPHLNYHNGDEIAMVAQQCPCGLEAFDLMFRDRASEQILYLHDKPGFERVTYHSLLIYLRDVLSRLGIQPEPPVSAAFAISRARTAVNITILNARVKLARGQEQIVAEYFKTLGFELVTFGGELNLNDQKLKPLVES